MNRSRSDRGIAWCMGTLALSDDATLTQAQVHESFNITQAGTGKTITLPAAAAVYKGIVLFISSIHASSATNKITVAAGFCGGGANYDYITLPALGSAIVWCDGTYWYAAGNMNPAAS